MHARSKLAMLMVLAMVAITPSAVIRASGPTVTVEDLGPTGVMTNGRGVNASGLAVGFGNDGTLDFGFTHGATLAYVPVPDPGDALQALAVNDAGVVVGSYIPESGFRQPFRYDSISNVLTAVPFLSGASTATATAINASGVVAGFTTVGKFHGFRQTGADPAEDIGDLGGGSSAGHRHQRHQRRGRLCERRPESPAGGALRHHAARAHLARRHERAG